jgi:pentatricopeptide repeat protein
VPTEDTYALLLRAYCNAGSLHRAEGVISEMQENGIPPSKHMNCALLFYQRKRTSLHKKEMKERTFL